MAVDTFPVAFPIQQWASCDAFDPVRRQMGGLIGSGRDFVIDRGVPQWRVTAKTRPLTLAELTTMEGFKAKMRGAARYCTLYNPSHAFPVAYMTSKPPGWPTGFGAYAGACTLTAIGNSGLDGVGRDVLTLGGLPSGLSLISGDMLSFAQSGMISLHRVLDSAAQVASGGGAATVWVEPELPASMTTAAVGNLQNPVGKFRILDLQLPADSKGRYRPGSATFTAMSTLN
jgi:hypothetical protein